MESQRRRCYKAWHCVGYARLRKRGMMTADEVLRQAGISQQTLHRWRREGRVQAQAYNDRKQYLYWSP